MSYWEPQHGADGSIACAVVLPTASGFADKGGHYLALAVAVGILERKGEGRFTSDAKTGAMSYWEPQHGADGSIACAVVLPTANGFADKGGHYLALAAAQPGKPLRYYVGAGWSKSGDFPTPEAWEAYVRSYAARMATPLTVK